jgi:hypothetical protein
MARPPPKAITGIGSKNMIRVPVDEQARMDCQALDTILAECLKHRQAVYAIVVLIGTTEHGSVDPLSEILAIRIKYQRLGLSFLIHADAAWGGYFTSMLIPHPDLAGSKSHLDYPTLFVNAHTVNQLRHLRYADSVTLDPHKSGYTPFSAGALCYRDDRLRFMVTWNSPVIGVEEESLKMGVYGIEGRSVRLSNGMPRLLNAEVSFHQQTRRSTISSVAWSRGHRPAQRWLRLPSRAIGFRIHEGKVLYHRPRSYHHINKALTTRCMAIGQLCRSTTRIL